jgi:hypothetical protein
MILSLILAVLVLAIAYFQATQGLFSALIMVVLTICCAAAAFGTHEWVAVNWLAPYFLPDYSYSIALVAIFAIPLLGLRLAADNLIRRSGTLPLLADRIGAGICGLVTGMVMVGVMSIGLLGLPFGTSLLGFARVDVVTPDNRDEDARPKSTDSDEGVREILLKPDRFAFGVASMVGGGVFSGDGALAERYPDFVEAHAWVNAVPPEVSRFAPPNSIAIVRTEAVPFVYREAVGRPGTVQVEGEGAFEAIAPKKGHVFRMIRVRLKNEARDKGQSHTFTLRQFRLVGRPGPAQPEEQFHAIALPPDVKPGASTAVNRHIRFKKISGVDWPIIDKPLGPPQQSESDGRASRDPEVEVVFELPERFAPSYLEYKRGARAAVSFDAKAQPPPAAPEPEEAPVDEVPPDLETGAVAPSERGADAAQTPSSGGTIRRYTPRKGQSHFGDDMPMPLRSYRKLKSAAVQRGALLEGHLVGYVDEQESGKDEAVSRFQVPEDKRLLQLNVGYLQARSGLGRAISFAVATLQNYTVEDDKGAQYKIIGKYIIADVEGRQVIEVEYFGDAPVGSIGGLGPFEKIKESNLKGEYELVFLFLVEPGARITSFSTGGPATRRDDLSQENLVAPE